MEENIYEDVKKQIKDLPKIRGDIENAVGKLHAIEREKWSHFEESFFIERCIPMLIHLQISEAFQHIFDSKEDYQRVLLDYENKKVKEIHEYILTSHDKPSNLNSFKNRLLYLFRLFTKEQKGALPFTYGRDYRPDLTSNDIEKLN